MRNKVLIRMMIEIICIYHNNNNVIVLDYANNDDKESDDEVGILIMIINFTWKIKTIMR